MRFSQRSNSGDTCLRSITNRYRKRKDNVDDVFDQQLGEEILDAGEDASDKLEEIGKDIKDINDSVKDAAN
jgi:hypothetical protein